jgi:hypothetical protein
MYLCEPLWVSLTVEKLFIFNLDVLSTVLYRWRSLEITVKIRLKTRSRRLNPKLENTRKLLTPGNINQQELIQKPPYLH